MKEYWDILAQELYRPEETEVILECTEIDYLVELHGIMEDAERKGWF